MLTDKELDNFAAAARTDAAAQPSIVVTVNCDWGSDDPAQPKGPAKFEWVSAGKGSVSRDTDLPQVGTFHG